MIIGVMPLNTETEVDERYTLCGNDILHEIVIDGCVVYELINDRKDEIR